MKATYIKPLLPLRDIVIFPSMVVPLFVGREKSIKALQEVMKSDKSIDSISLILGILDKINLICFC